MHNLKEIKTTKFSLSKIISNIAWLFFDKIFKMLLGLIVIIMLARYLGPEQFGLMNYAIAIVSLFVAFSALGLNNIAVKELLTTNRNKNEILGSIFFLKVTGSIISYILLFILISTLRGDDEFLKYIVLILGITMFFTTSDIIKFWFESKINSKYIVYVENIVFLVFTIFKILLIYLEMSLISFIYIMVIESFFMALALLYIYVKKDNMPIWIFNIAYMKTLLHESWPLIISSMAWILYSRIDQIMIGEILNDKSVGIYSAATRLSEVSAFLPVIITSSIIPAIMKLQNNNKSLYNEKFQNIYNIVTIIMVFLALLVTFNSSMIISILYGSSYIEASNVLVIHFWLTIFIGLATVSGRYLLNEGLQKITMKRHLVGIGINIPLNYIAIPLYGIEGAAFASLFSFIIANYIFDYFNKDTIVVFKQKTNALFFIWIINLYKKKFKLQGR
jgi:O-antigen/teichoic acid export membrane protein